MSFVEIVLYLLIVQAVFLLLILLPFVPVSVVRLFSKTYGLIFRNQGTAMAYYSFFTVMLVYGVAQFVSASRQAHQIQEFKESSRPMDFEKEMNGRMRQFHDQRNGYITIFAAYLSLAIGLAFKRIDGLAPAPAAKAAAAAPVAAAPVKSSSSSSSPAAKKDD